MKETVIVILNHNGKQILDRFLPQIIQNSKPFPIYIIDNGSSDNSLTFLKTNYPTIHSYSLPTNQGFYAYNLLFDKLSAKYYVIMNSDVVPEGNWLQPMIEFMDQNPKIGICQPKILSYQIKDSFHYSSGAGGFIDRLGYPFCRGRMLHYFEKDEGQYDDIKEIFWAHGACFCIQAEVFKKVNGYDKNFFMYFEEIDLCWRVKKANYQVYYYGLSKIYHQGGGTIHELSPYKLYLNIRNRLLTLYKNIPVRKFIFKYPLIVILDFITALVKIFQNRKNFQKICKAHIDFWKLTKNYSTLKRENIKNEFPTLYEGYLLFDVFFKRKRKFTELKFK